MKKKLLAILFAAVAITAGAFGFTACGVSPDSGNGGGGGNKEENPGHVHRLSYVSEKSPSCTEEGNQAYYTCNDCGKLFLDANGQDEIFDKMNIVLKPTEHNMKPVAANPESCIENGNNPYFVCEKCNNWYHDVYGNNLIENKNDVVIPARTHHMTTIAEQPASCMWEGNIEYYTCDYCTNSFYDIDGKNKIADEADVIIPVSKHKMTFYKEIPATCTKEGNSAYYVCGECSNWYEDKDGKTQIYDQMSVIIGTDGHKMTRIDEVPATCTEDGMISYYSCDKCHKAFREIYGGAEITNENDFVIPAGHSLIYEGYVEPTCTEDGQTEYYVCSGCDKYFEDWQCKREITDKTSVVLPKGHQTGWYPGFSATCTGDGKKDYFACYRCQKWFTDEDCTDEIADKEKIIIPASGHDISFFEAKAATCTERGNLEHYECGNCNGWFTDADGKNEISEIYNYQLPSLGHNKTYVSKNDATCTEDGNETYYACENCGKWYYENAITTEITDKSTVIIAATGHSYFDNWHYNTAKHWHECSACEFKKDEDTHTLDCDVCEGENYTEGLRFQLNNQGTAYTVFGGEATAAEILIPSEYWGLPVTVIGYGAFKDNTDLTSVSIPYGVTNIDYSAFKGCTGLTEIEIPDSVTNVEWNAFSECAFETATIPANAASAVKVSSLKTVVITSGTSIEHGAFNSCANLESVSLPDGITIIDEMAFYGCSSLTSINLPEGITKIGSSAFSYCTSLEEIELPDGLETIGSNVFQSCSNLLSISIPDSVNNTGSYIFYNCGSLATVSLPDGITWIGNSTFAKCTSLTEIDIPDSVTIIDRNAFNGCTLLSEIVIPDGVSEIGEYAFNGCTSLAEIVIPDGVSELEKYTFGDCTSLKTVTVPDSVTTIDIYAFKGCSIENATIPSLAINRIKNDNLITVKITSLNSDKTLGGLSNCVNLASVELPDGLKSLDTSAFSGCTSLRAINIPESLETIGISAFRGCVGLTAIELPDGLISIGDNAFNGCTGLTEIEIPDSVTTLDFSAFSGCADLTSAIIGKGITTIPNSTFANCSSLKTLTIPDSVTYIHSTSFTGCPIETATIPAIAISDIKNDNLTTVVITSGTSIKQNALKDCAKLTTVSIPDSITSVGKDAFSGCDKLEYTRYDDPGTNRNVNNTYYLGNSDNPYLVAMKPIDTEKDSCSTRYMTKVIADYAYSGYTNLKYFSIGYGEGYGDGVQYIGAHAFENCTSLINTNSEHVKEIGEYAFSGCTVLRSLHTTNMNNPLPTVRVLGDYAFNECTSLTAISLPAIEVLGNRTFYKCTALKSAQIGDSLKSIGEWIFGMCTAFEYNEYNGGLYVGNTNNPYLVLMGEGNSNPTSLVVHDDTKLIAGRAFSLSDVESVTLPDGLIYISAYAFRSCQKLTSINIPESVIYIGVHAFEYCSSLTSITIPGSLEEIDNVWFTDCSALTEVIIGDGITELCVFAFQKLTGLTTVTIPDSVTEIGVLAFSGCTKLTTIKFTGTIAQWKAIKKDTSWNSAWNNNTGSYTVICKDGTLSKSQS